jgi:hypothetical protein
MRTTSGRRAPRWEVFGSAGKSPRLAPLPAPVPPTRLPGVEVQNADRRPSLTAGVGLDPPPLVTCRAYRRRPARPRCRAARCRWRWCSSRASSVGDNVADVASSMRPSVVNRTGCVVVPSSHGPVRSHSSVPGESGKTRWPSPQNIRLMLVNTGSLGWLCQTSRASVCSRPRG